MKGRLALIGVSAGVLLTACAPGGPPSPATSAPGPSTSAGAFGSRPGSAASDSASTGAPATSPTPSLPSRPTVTAALVKLTGDKNPSVVPVATGYEAVADHKATSAITFWRYRPGGEWTQIGSSSYPDPSHYGGEAGLGVLSGAVLTGMDEPTFVGGGIFSNGLRHNTIVYADGPNGWGAVVPSGPTLIPSGKGISVAGPAVYLDAALIDGRLETYTCLASVDDYDCTAKTAPVFWEWHGTSFGAP